MSLVNKPANYALLLFVVAIPVLIYLYFLQWKTGTIYGDDLYIFRSHEALNGLAAQISIPVSFGKYRPVHGISMHFLIAVFQKNINAYYIFNVAIQTINTLLFAATAYLFVGSRFIALLSGLLIGLSRFSFFNMVQLLNGGALEGLAMTFFLAALLFLLRAIKNDAYPPAKKDRAICWSILFANASMYTHERYIVLLPFIALLIFLYPGLKLLRQKQKLKLVFFALASIAMNVILKKAIFSMPFFMGTAGTSMQFSFSSAIAFFTEAVASILQWNTGPQHLVGIDFISLPFLSKLPVLIFMAGLLIVLVAYIKSVRQQFVTGKREIRNHFWIFLSLAVLFGLFLTPAVVTIRLEQRWLQASYSIFILMFLIAFTEIPFRNRQTKMAALSAWVVLLFCVDGNYLKLGANNSYLVHAEKTAHRFEQAIRDGTIRAGTNKIYFWEKQRDPNTESSINWELGNGYFFKFYQGRNKKILFVDADFQNSHPHADSAITNLNMQTAQVIYLDTALTDITEDYLQDSLRSFSTRMDNAALSGKNKYFKRQLSITADKLDQFSATGFYENESGMRWTNGNASISFEGSQLVKDTLRIELDTFMPEVCRNVHLRLAVTGVDKKIYEPLASTRKGDLFTFLFYFAKPVQVRQITIKSEKISGNPNDQRVLSFPFKGVVVK
ncbi:MAG: hypothetical protein ABIU63_02250 [Chitinophagaceae bacterium]